jgi:NTP pyrophosphatase (non-canonical NTP hydrolase)
MNKENIYKQAGDLFGQKAQIIVAIEEMSELIQALTKYLRTDMVTENLAEEIVDVEIMIEQLRFIFKGINSMIDETKVYKLERLERKIKDKA